MSDVQNLSAELRSRAGKGAARQTRRDGRVPGVIYGNKQPATLISVEPRELLKQLRKKAFHATLPHTPPVWSSLHSRSPNSFRFTRPTATKSRRNTT